MCHGDGMNRPEMYQKKPVDVCAIQYTGNNQDVIEMFCHNSVRFRKNGARIHTPEGIMVCRPGDWIVRGIHGEFYPVQDHIFQKTYSKV